MVLDKMKIMKNLFLLLLLALVLMSAGKPAGKKGVFLIEGSVTQSGQYCGGARPTEEMEREARRPYPLAGFTLYLKRDTINNLDEAPIDSVVTDAEGHFEIKLPSGDYILVEALKVDRKAYDKVVAKATAGSDFYAPADQKCLDKWAVRPFMRFTVVDQDMSMKTVNIFKRCFSNGLPCSQYIGPYPP